MIRLIWGGDLNPALRPVIAVSLIGSIAGLDDVARSSGSGRSAISHASSASLAFAYLTGAVLSGVVG